MSHPATPSATTNPFPPSTRVRFNELLTTSMFGKHLFTAADIEDYTAIVEQTPGYISRYNKRQKVWIRDRYCAIDGVLFRKMFPNTPEYGLRLVVSDEEIFDLVVGDHIKSGHANADATAIETWKKYYGIGKGEVKAIVELCQVCNAGKGENKEEDENRKREQDKNNDENRSGSAKEGNPEGEEDLPSEEGRKQDACEEADGEGCGSESTSDADA